MSWQVSGYECPDCGNLGPHPVLEYDWVDCRISLMILHCNKCEHVWESET